MSSPVLLVILFHELKIECPNALQKLLFILCANFRMLFLPASVATPVSRPVSSAQFLHFINKIATGINFLPLESLTGTFVAMRNTRRSHCCCRVAIQCFAPNASPLLTMVRYRACTVVLWHSKCSTQVTWILNHMFYISKVKWSRKLSLYLTVAIGFILDDATRRTFSTFLQRCIDVILKSIQRDVNDRPLIPAYLSAIPNEIHFSGRNHWSQHLNLRKHLQKSKKITDLFQK